MYTYTVGTAHIVTLHGMLPCYYATATADA